MIRTPTALAVGVSSNNRRCVVLRQKYHCLILAAALTALVGNGCRAQDTGDDVRIYYSAIEDGDYYEGWALQLQEQAAAHGEIGRAHV